MNKVQTSPIIKTTNLNLALNDHVIQQRDIFIAYQEAWQEENTSAQSI